MASSLRTLKRFKHRSLDVNIGYHRLYFSSMSPQQIDPKAIGMTFAQRYEQKDENGNVKLMVGDYTTYSKEFSANDVAKFSKITINDNPLHSVDDDTAAKKAGFNGSLIHGMFSASIFSAAIGAHFPGSIAFDMNIRFRKPVYVNDCLHGIVTVNRVLGRKKLVKCLVAAVNQHGELCVTGGVTLLVKNLEEEKRKVKEKLL